MLHAHRDGHRVVLVTCTRGEVGEIHNMDEAATRPHLAEVRTEELKAAAKLLGVDRLEFLGYRDSGMDGTGDNSNPASFHMAPLADAAARLARILREERPEVVVTYGPDGIYYHPDHVKAHHVTHAALDLLETEGWKPIKLYHVALVREDLEEMRRRMQEADRPDVFQDPRIVGIPRAELGAVIDCRDVLETKRAAFLAHTSQMAPESFFLNTPDHLFEQAFGHESFVLARGEAGPEPETDLLSHLA